MMALGDFIEGRLGRTGAMIPTATVSRITVIKMRPVLAARAPDRRRASIWIPRRRLGCDRALLQWQPESRPHLNQGLCQKIDQLAIMERRRRDPKALGATRHGRVIDRLNVYAVFAEQEVRSEEHTSELQSLRHLVCRLLLEKKN